jgi:uncharacterized protein (DUF1015 family)
VDIAGGHHRLTAAVKKIGQKQARQVEKLQA